MPVIVGPFHRFHPAGTRSGRIFERAIQQASRIAQAVSRVHEATGAGNRGFTTDPSGAVMCTGRYTPSLWGMSGVVTVVRNATYTQVAVLAIGELTKPVTWGSEPAKSTQASSPSMRIVTLILMGVSLNPSESRKRLPLVRRRP